MARENILNTSEATEISYRRVIDEFKEDVYPAFKDEGIPIGVALMIYNQVCHENLLTEIRDLLLDKYA